MESSCWFHISWNHGYSRKIRFTLFCSILVTKNSVLLSVTFEHKVSVSWKESSSSAAFIPYFFQSSSLPLPHSLPFPFEDSSLWNCLQFYGLNRIFRCFFGKYFHLKLSKGSCTLISIFAGHPHLGFLQASQIQPIWGGRYLCTLDQYLSQIIPILPVTRGQTPLLILPAISCPLLLILRTWSIPLLSALQKPCFSSFITLDLWYGSGILSGLSTSCLSYSQSISYTVARQFPLFQESGACLPRPSPCRTVQDLSNFTQSCRSFLASSFPLYTLCMRVCSVASVMSYSLQHHGL